MIAPLKTVLFPPATLKGLQQLFALHGARLEIHDEAEERYPHCLIMLPEGTRRERDGYMLRNEYNKITLLDGFVFYQTVHGDGWSVIYFPCQEDWLIAKVRGIV